MGIFFTIFYQPVANLLFLLMNVLQTESLLIGILMMVFATRLALLPLFIKSAKIQIRTKRISGEIKKIQKNVKDRAKQAEETLKLYKRENINPFTSILFLFIQIPIFISIFFVVRDVGELDFVQSDVLYQFVNEVFIDFGGILLNLTDSGGILMALLVGVTQFLVIYQSQKHTTASIKKHGVILITVFTVLAMVVSVFFVATVGLYWFFNNLVSIIQEIVILDPVRSRENAAT